MPETVAGPCEAEAKLVCLLSASAPSIALAPAVVAAIREGGRASPATATTTLITLRTGHFVVHLLDSRHECVSSNKHCYFDANGEPSFAAHSRPDSSTRAEGCFESKGAIVSASEVSVPACRLRSGVEQRTWLALPVFFVSRDDRCWVWLAQRPDLACSDRSPNTEVGLTLPATCPTTQVASVQATCPGQQLRGQQDSKPWQQLRGRNLRCPC